MDVALVISRRLKELGFEQKDLASAAQVTESYISQLLAGKKAPPAPDRRRPAPWTPAATPGKRGAPVDGRDKRRRAAPAPAALAR